MKISVDMIVISIVSISVCSGCICIEVCEVISVVINSVGMKLRLCIVRLKKMGVGRMNSVLCYVMWLNGLFLWLKDFSVISVFSMNSRIDRIIGKYFGFMCSDVLMGRFMVC